MALGEPRGSGGARVSPDSSHQEIWFYEYTELRGKRVFVEILLVFLDADRYDGHLWFRSSERVHREK